MLSVNHSAPVRSTRPYSLSRRLRHVVRDFAQQPATPGAVRVEAPLPAIRKSYRTSRPRVYQNPGPDSWLQIRGTATAVWGFWPLDRRSRRRTSSSGSSWRGCSSTGAKPAAHEAAPLDRSGGVVISVRLLRANQVIAIEREDRRAQLLALSEGTPLQAAIVMRSGQRGVADCAETKCSFASSAAVLVALDAKTGKEVLDRDRRRQRDAATT